ncbi:regulator of G-protein signaling 9-binding protein-like [Oryzias latipes]|uniref:Zgc:109913 n=1 Tax=Oryzias latipes TaxID=8090 RepID=H2LZY4_ORYLA|nr:regulator of G-protein signaling 9-binding protein-like [Oryzias latipes]XP_020558966.1 regulator of G-protein signaling 9-binding protein-like [Oryzias latipes]XP_020558967.1 regulator of G-protein signaling 9-binding protein-like [Oryzias latipes]
MSRWRRSVDELAAARQQSECQRAQDSLSRVTSCFQQLVSSLGSSADNSFLRDEIEDARVLAHRICSGLSRRLLHLLSECNPAPSGVQDTQGSERLWVLFLSAVENFLSDLRKASDLTEQFPLTQRSSRRALINTGCVDGMVGLAARVALVQVPWLILEEEPSPDLTNHITGLETMLGEMQTKIPIAFWSVEATQPAWAEAQSEFVDPDDSLEDLMEVEVVSSGKDGSSCCALGCIRR